MYMSSKIAQKAHAKRMEKWEATEGAKYKTGPKKGQLKPRPEKPKGLSEKQEFFIKLFDDKLKGHNPQKLRMDGDKIKYSASYHLVVHLSQWHLTLRSEKASPWEQTDTTSWVLTLPVVWA